MTSASSTHPLDGALARCVGDVDEFATRYWGRVPLLRRASHGPLDTFDDVFSTDELDRFLAGGLRRPIIRVVQNGDPVPAERYTGRVRLGGSDFRDVVSPERVAELFSGGATVVAQSLHRTHPTVRAFVDAMGCEISHPVQANAYLTPPEATGLAPHADRHDVIVLQLEGSKCWFVEAIGEFELCPGDALYVPAGHRHSAVSGTRSSLHLTLGILRVTYRSVLDRVLRAGPEMLDDPLPLRYRNGGDDQDMQRRLATVFAEVRQYLASADPDDVAEAERARRVTRPPRPGALTDAIALAELDSTAHVERAGDRWTTTRPNPSTIRVEANGRWLAAPIVCESALEQCGSGHVVRVGDLQGLDADSHVILARRLVAAGLCRLTGR